MEHVKIQKEKQQNNIKAWSKANVFTSVPFLPPQWPLPSPSTFTPNRMTLVW